MDYMGALEQRLFDSPLQRACLNPEHATIPHLDAGADLGTSSQSRYAICEYGHQEILRVGGHNVPS